jgi:3-oxoacyl-[acyl-carrier-protein] synthase II
MNRVVITGIGAVTPIGIGKDEFWDSIIKGKSGVAPITRFNTDEFDTKIAAEVKDFEPRDYIDLLNML